jgi:hypothetical protein
MAIVDTELEITEQPAETVVEPGKVEPTEPDEVVVTIGDEPPPEEAETPQWVKDTRAANRELVRKVKALEEEKRQRETAKATLGPKPKLEDFDYDAEKFEQGLDHWFTEKREADAKAAESAKAEESQKQAWQGRLDAHEQSKAKLKVPDYSEAEDLVKEMFSITQQGIILQGSDDSALICYALGKNPSKAKELASITDPVKFSFAIARLETTLKVTNRKAATTPERVITGTGSKSASVDSKLDALRADADKTGDFTKVIAYKTALKRKAA